MIDGVGKSGSGRIELKRSAVEGGAPVAQASSLAERAGGASAGNAVADLVAAGPPVDSAKVAAIRAAIAEGRYPVDPFKIAERIIALDLAGAK